MYLEARFVPSLKSNTWLAGFIFVSFATITLAYNLDADNAKVFSDPTGDVHRRGSYFGFSVALYVNAHDSPVLLVGAPRANTSALQGVTEPGTVYQCPLNGTCKQWIVDKSSNGWTVRSARVDQIKDNAWIGATLAVENKTDPRVVVCGPRWKQRSVFNWYMNGICYRTVAKSARSFEVEAEDTIIPLYRSGTNDEQIVSWGRYGIFKYGMGQAGFSVHMTSNELMWNLVLGAPGVLNWNGVPLMIAKAAVSSGLQTIIPAVDAEPRVQSFDYLGYAVTSGSYFKTQTLLYASSAPKGGDMYGKVFIFTFPDRSNRRLGIKKIVQGEQHGEYFGAALASCDLNNDGKDELIVGAPTWSKDTDEGRVYVFTARHNENFEMQVLEGQVSSGRFGTTITCLGDIDYDGYGDIAVGAPYENGTGAIYIFNGNSNGLAKQHSQKIVGSEFGQGIRGFGISISEPRDVNGDRYSDIAVGAFLSEKAVLLKSKPVVTLITKLAYTETKRILGNSTSFLIDACTSYSGLYAPESLQIVKILKIDQLYGRATYGTGKNNENTYRLPDTLHKSKVLCSQIKINLKPNIQNLIDPIEISLSIVLEDDKQMPDRGNKNPASCTPCAVVNKQLSKTEDMLKVPFEVDCGDDEICTSDIGIILLTDLEYDNKYIIGSMPTVKLSINAQNRAEPAYQAKTHVYIPKVLPLASIPTECMEGTFINDTLEVICDIGNPLRKNKMLVLELDMSQIRFDSDRVEIRANVSTQSEEANLLDNSYSLTMHFDLDVDIAIAGKAQEDLYSYFRKNEEGQLKALRFQHIYEVQKFGPSPIEEAVLMIDVPVYWKHSIGDIEIINVNQTMGYMVGQPFYCTNSNSTGEPLVSVAYKPSAHSVYTEMNNTYERFTIDEDTSINLPPSNRSLFINCTNPAVKCKRFMCKLGSFVSSLSVAKLSLMLQLQLLNFQPDMMEGKDIIFFVSTGSVNITQPSNVTQRFGQKPDSTIVATTFVGSPIAEKVSNWIILLSILLGIILLTLLVWGLVKVGFFNRKKKKELEALMAQTDRAHRITLETTSSREVLDQE